jgi:hypothetical protein
LVSFSVRMTAAIRLLAMTTQQPNCRHFRETGPSLGRRIDRRGSEVAAGTDGATGKPREPGPGSGGRASGKAIRPCEPQAPHEAPEPSGGCARRGMSSSPASRRRLTRPRSRRGCARRRTQSRPGTPRRGLGARREIHVGQVDPAGEPHRSNMRSYTRSIDTSRPSLVGSASADAHSRRPLGQGRGRPVERVSAHAHAGQGARAPARRSEWAGVEWVAGRGILAMGRMGARTADPRHRGLASLP